MLKVIRTNFDRREMRRDRRTPLPRLVVSIGNKDYEAQDWSLGGFQTIEGPAIGIGAHVTGKLRVAGRDEAYSFEAEAVRCIRTTHGVGFHFLGLSPELVTALDRAVMRRFVGRR